MGRVQPRLVNLTVPRASEKIAAHKEPRRQLVDPHACYGQVPMIKYAFLWLCAWRLLNAEIYARNNIPNVKEQDAD